MTHNWFKIVKHLIEMSPPGRVSTKRKDGSNRGGIQQLAKEPFLTHRASVLGGLKNRSENLRFRSPLPQLRLPPPKLSMARIPRRRGAQPRALFGKLVET